MRPGVGVGRLDLAFRRRSTVGYSAGMALYTLVVVALYPAFKSSTSLDQFARDNAAVAALFGVSGTLTSPGGWLNANVYANFFPLLMLLLTVGYGAAALAGQDEDGTLGLVATLPVRRRTVVVQKAAAMAWQGLVLAATVAACVLVGRTFGVAVAAWHVLSASFGVLLMGLDLGLATLAVGAATGKRGTALGVGSALAGASYLVSSLAPAVSWIRPARFASVFYWAVGNDQIDAGTSLLDVGVLLAVALGALWAAVVTFRRLDLH